jgi:hypothetical protein
MSAIRLVPNRSGTLFLLLSGAFLVGEEAVAGPMASRASPVRDRLAAAARALRVMTGRTLDARTFPGWWKVHGDADGRTGG